MSSPDPQALAPLLPLLRQLRELKGVREVRPGVLQCRGQPFLQIQDAAGGLHAELRKAGGPGFDRYPVGSAPEQRKLVEDAKRRAAQLGDDD